MKPIDSFCLKPIDSFCLKPIDWPLTHSIDQDPIKTYNPLKIKGKFKMRFFETRGGLPFRPIAPSFLRKAVLELGMTSLLLTIFWGVGCSSIERTSLLGTGLGASVGAISSTQLGTPIQRPRVVQRVLF